MNLYHDNNILINETFIVDHSVKEKWLQWFSEKIIAILIKLPVVSQVVFSRVVQKNNPDGCSFALQFRVKRSDADIMKSNTDLRVLRKQMFEDFHGLIASFITELDILYDD